MVLENLDGKILIFIHCTKWIHKNISVTCVTYFYCVVPKPSFSLFANPLSLYSPFPVGSKHMDTAF